ncbi:MAG: nicotinate-nucleotide adenylyltransferase [Proteobacteria bacterium]|jgi:nicotinate-nucleotide adenylyltransferase|nr:nicotinate-nucleotide adenylyltransferase [Pseudomonadota bacterium]
MERRVGANDAAKPYPAPIALLGGTFDPVHYGHLRFADEARAALALPEVRLVPSAVPPHRGAPGASAADRLAMLELAVREFPGLVVDPCELRRGGRSYTVDTLAALRDAHPRTPLILLVGADAFRGLAGWHQWRRLFELAHIIVAPRPGSTPGEGLAPELADEWNARIAADPAVLRSTVAGSIHVQPISAQPIAATAIRDALRRLPDGRGSLARLLPPAVLTYIESNRLYRSPTNAT